MSFSSQFTENLSVRSRQAWWIWRSSFCYGLLRRALSRMRWALAGTRFTKIFLLRVDRRRIYCRPTGPTIVGRLLNRPTIVGWPLVDWLWIIKIIHSQSTKGQPFNHCWRNRTFAKANVLFLNNIPYLKLIFYTSLSQLVLGAISVAIIASSKNNFGNSSAKEA